MQDIIKVKKIIPRQHPQYSQFSGASLNRKNIFKYLLTYLLTYMYWNLN